jgi:hypothetical protein
VARVLASDFAKSSAPELTGPGEEFFIPIGDIDPAYLCFDKEVYTQMAALLDEFRHKQLSFRNAVMARFFIADPLDEWELIKQIYKSFGGKLEPDTVVLRHPQAPVRIWSVTEKPRTKKEPFLTNTDAVQWRAVQGRSFATFAPLLACWPPPLTVGPGAGNDLLWKFTVEKAFVENERDVLWTLGVTLRMYYEGYFFAVVRLSPS